MSFECPTIQIFGLVLVQGIVHFSTSYNTNAIPRQTSYSYFWNKWEICTHKILQPIPVQIWLVTSQKRCAEINR